MKKLFLILVLLFSAVSIFSQSSTSVNVNIDQYDWNRLSYNHFFNKENGISVQFWYKQTTDAKRVRAYYQRRFNYAKGKTGVQLTGGLGGQGTTRKRKTISYQFYTFAEMQYKFKINKNCTFNSRLAENLTISPKASQGDHTSKTITEAGGKYQKTNIFYHAEYLYGFKGGLRENFQGVGIAYDLAKKFTIGGIAYTDLKEKNKNLHFAITFGIKLK